MGLSKALVAFAEEVGVEGDVTCVGGMTQWAVGGVALPGARQVRAPSGVVSHQPAEMIVRVRAGTTLAELRDALRGAGQHVALEAASPGEATVGGILSVGHSGVRRLGWGPIRDSVLEVTAVGSGGQLIRSGAPLVKNVTGFDLCRLLIGSLGTLALVGEVVLRCQPLPEAEGWWVAEGVDPFAVVGRLYRPTSVLWDGDRTWVALSGYRADLAQQATQVLGPDFREVDGPPSLPGPARASVMPAQLATLSKGASNGAWLAEVGVGVVHCEGVSPGEDVVPAPPDGLARLHEAIKCHFDPQGRLNPGRTVLAGSR